MVKNSFLAAGIFSVLLTFSCSINYDESSLADKILKNTPDSVLYSFIYTESNNGHKSFSIYADKAMTFNTKQQTLLQGVVFQQFDENNNIITEGKADRGTIFTENNNAEISGNIKIYTSREKAQLGTTYLYWDNDKKTLTGQPDAVITITKDSGTIIRGKDFKGNMLLKTYTLNGGVTGEYINEEN